MALESFIELPLKVQQKDLFLKCILFLLEQKFSHHHGTTTLKDGKIFYKNGTLTNSLINGYMFIADELNL